jgi:hypothetical protein
MVFSAAPITFLSSQLHMAILTEPILRAGALPNRGTTIKTEMSEMPNHKSFVKSAYLQTNGTQEYYGGTRFCTNFLF